MFADPLRLEQMLGNLVGNALRIRPGVVPERVADQVGEHLLEAQRIRTHRAVVVDLDGDGTGAVADDPR